MQNTMLDSTVSQLLQDNSSIEYVAPEKNPLTTIQTEPKNLASVTPLFDFHAVHNGEACIESLDPKDRGTERQFRFTRALLCTLLGVKSEDTITNHVDKLLKRGVIDNTKNLVLLRSEHGRETTLYDLKVFNYLVKSENTITAHVQALINRGVINDVKNLTSLIMAKFRPISMILRLSHACLPISLIRVPEIGIENVPELEIENVPVEELDPFRLLHACVPNRLRFVSRRKTIP